MFVPAENRMAVFSVVGGKPTVLTLDVEHGGIINGQQAVPNGARWPIRIDGNGTLVTWVPRENAIVAGGKYTSDLVSGLQLRDLFASGGRDFVNLGGEWYVRDRTRLLDLGEAVRGRKFCANRTGNRVWSLSPPNANRRCVLAEYDDFESGLAHRRVRSVGLPAVFEDNREFCDAAAAEDGTICTAFVVAMKDVPKGVPRVALPRNVERPSIAPRGLMVVSISPSSSRVEQLAAFEWRFPPDLWEGPVRGNLLVDRKGEFLYVLFRDDIFRLPLRGRKDARALPANVRAS
jgi:hypothetical protein